MVVPFSNRDYVGNDYVTRILIKEDVTPVLFNQIKQVLTQQSQLIYPIGFEVNGFIVGTDDDNLYFDPNASSRKNFSYFPASNEININIENKNMDFCVHGINTLSGGGADNLGCIYVSYDDSVNVILVRLGS